MKEELRNVTDSSDLGRRMLGFAWEKVHTEISTEKMQRVMDELTMAPITVQSVSVAKATLHTELQDIDAAVGKRNAVICYRGVPITIGVQSVHEEVQLRIAAAIKTVAADLLCLEPLFCETELVAKPRPTWVGITVDSELLKEATVARSTANNFLAAADQTGEAVKEALQRKQALLLGIDATFMLEVSFFANMLGEAGTSRLQQEILRCFPSEDRAVTLVACAQTLTQLASTQLMRFVTKSAQGLFKAVREAVSSLEFGRRPTFDSESTNAAFMTSVVGRLGFFVVEDTEASFGSPSAKVYGAAAMKVKYDKLSAAIAASRAYGLADLEPFQMYAWLITDDMKKEVDTWAAALLEGLGESTAGKGASSSGDAGKGVV